MLPKDPSARRAFAAATGLTTSVCVSVFSLAMAAKNPESSFWFWATVIAAAGFLGAGYDLYRVVREQSKPKGDDDNSNDDNKPGSGPKP